MKNKPYLLGIDQGTSGSRALILDREGTVRGYGYRALPRRYPRQGWVEQDARQVLEGVAQAIAGAIEEAGCRPDEIAACGIDCQRNTEFVWDARTHQPLANPITWQDLRTQAMLESIQASPLAGEIRRRLGRGVSATSSALHLAWRMQNQPAVRAAADQGRLHSGFSAEWLLVAMGKPSGHYMDYSLVQAMGLYDFRARHYWQDWLDLLGVPRAILPDPQPSIFDYGTLEIAVPGSAPVDLPVLAMIGDQQAALFGYDCRHVGEAECTHGTASFVNLFLGAHAPELESLNIYYAWILGEPPVQPPPAADTNPGLQFTYCLEADTTVTGAALRWMRENAHLLAREGEIDELAASVPDAGGVVFVPAFTGLNVPYDDPHARGSLLGLTLGANRAHITRAFLDAIGFQLRAILEQIQRDTGLVVDALKVGGGISASDIACQVQADWLGIPVIRPSFTQTSARAAALLAGLGAGFWSNVKQLPLLPGEHTIFEPRLSKDQADDGYAQWQQAVRIVQSWAAREL